jgi:hypothetical protein
MKDGLALVIVIILTGMIVFIQLLKWMGKGQGGEEDNG